MVIFQKISNLCETLNPLELLFFATFVCISQDREGRFRESFVSLDVEEGYFTLGKDIDQFHFGGINLGEIDSHRLAEERTREKESLRAAFPPFPRPPQKSFSISMCSYYQELFWTVRQSQ